MSTYNCEKCNFSTDRLNNWKRHNLSKKHQKCSTNNRKLVKNKQYECKFCTKTFTTDTSRYRHQRLSCEKKKEKDEMHELIKMLAESNRELVENNRELAENNRELAETTIESTKNNTEVFIKYANRSISVLGSLMARFPDAPPIESLKGKKLEGLVEYHGDTDKSTEEVIIHYYEKKKLHELLGKLLIQEYRKDDPKKQSIWSSDVSRLTFILRQLTKNNTTEWIVDKNGVDFKHIIINPLVNKVHNMIKEYVKDCHNTIVKNNDDNNHKISLLMVMQKCIDISQSINLDKLSGDILRYIAPYFNFKKI